MAKTITRQTLKLFGKDGPSSNFGQFGSQAAGSPVNSKSISTIQGLTAWLNGWQDAVAAGQAPYLQDVNALFYVLAYQLAYQLQDGIAEWDSGTSYYIGSVVRRAGTNEIYSSLTDDNLNHALPTAGTSDANWQFVAGVIAGVYRLGTALNMNSLGITNLPAASANGQAIRYEQVNRLWSYRRPVLQWSSTTQVNLETGNQGVAGAVTILFPDGTARTDSTAAHVNFLISRNAALSGSAQSGLRSGSAAANTWYALYAVKVTDNATDFVVVGDTVMPLQANFATLNANFGANGWVYLGVIPYGDAASASTSIPKFVMSGNVITFYNIVAGGPQTTRGVLLARATATTCTWTYAAGSSLASGQVPGQIVIGDIAGALGSDSTIGLWDSTGNILYLQENGNTSSYRAATIPNVAINLGFKQIGGTSMLRDILLSSYKDSVLGVGSNPLL